LEQWGRLNPTGFARELNESFGDELWRDGELCYKDGVQLKDLFKLTNKDLIALTA